MSEVPLQVPAAAKASAHSERHPSWWVLLIALVAMIGLYFQRPDNYPSVQTPLLALMLIGAWLAPWRLPSGGVIPYLVRGTLFFTLIMIAPERKISVRFWYQDPAIMHLMGTLLASDLIVQQLSPRRTLLRLGLMLTTITGIMAAATNSTNDGPMTILAPLFALGMLAALRPYAPQQVVSPATQRATPRRISRRWLANGIALVLSLSIGFAGVSLIRGYQRLLNSFGNRLVQWIRPPMRIGMSDGEMLQSSYNLTNSLERMLKITGTNRMMHLRGIAYDTYNEGQWQPRLSGRKFLTLESGTMVPPDARMIRVERLSDTLPILYLPLNASAVTPEFAGRLEQEETHHAVVQAIPDKEETVVYQFALPPREEAQGLLCKPLSEPERKRCLTVPPEIDPRVRQLGESLRKEQPVRTVMAIVQNLHENHQYTLKAQMGEGDLISDFILNKRDAHCQYFASAATILLRSAGIPARYVSGYFAHEGDGKNAMVVRSCDAHAWSEAWIDGIGWVTVEATPASGTPDKTARKPGLYEELRDGLKDLFSAAGAFFKSLSWYHIAAAGLVLTLLAAGLQVLRARREKRKRPIVRIYSFPSEKYKDLALEFERTLRRLGDIPPGTATWSEHLRDQRQQASGLLKGRQARLEAAARFVDAYNRLRFGNPEDPVALAELERLLHDVRRDR